MSVIVQVLIFIISYFLSKKAGATSGQAALLATGATLLSNSTGLTDTLANGVSSWFGGDDPQGRAGSGDPTLIESGSNLKGNIGQVGAVVPSSGSSISDVLKSWGPTGTALVGATAAGALTDNKWLLYGGLAIVAILIIK